MLGLYDLHSSESAYSLYLIVESRVQGDPNQSLLIQMAITLKICISDPKLVKPKSFSEAHTLILKIVNKQLKNQNLFIQMAVTLKICISGPILGSKKRFGFTKVGSKMPIFRVIAI